VIAIGAEGETDELGVPYPQPLLKGLITAGKVAYFNADLGMSGHDPETIRQFDDLLNASLADRRTLTAVVLGLGGSPSSGDVIKPADWLKAQPAPVFAPRSTLSPLSR
jgi:hypothetical protein